MQLPGGAQADLSAGRSEIVDRLSDAREAIHVPRLLPLSRDLQTDPSPHLHQVRTF